jgi:acyl-CoA thioesterase
MSMQESEYDRHVAVSESGPGEHAAELADGWRVGGGLNGGYLLSVVGSALRAHDAKRPDPVSVSAYYLSAAVAGPATVRTRTVREGRSTAVLAADLEQGGEARISALATYGDLARLPDEVATTARPPVIPPLEQCVSNERAPAELRAVAPLMDRFEMFFDPACAGWTVGEPSGRGVLQAWFRLVDGREPDPISLLTVVDALPPVTFDLGRPGWAPTMELTVHVRAVPAPGWLVVRHETRNVAGGMFEEDCEVWDSAGRLVAQSRQLARVPRPA